MSHKLTIKHLLGLENVPASDIRKIIDVGFILREILERPIKKIPTLNGKNIVNMFFENSTRTRISFELAEKRLSADVTNFSASSSSVNKGESLRDTVQNLLSMKLDCIVMRHPIPGSCYQVTNYVDSVVINAGDGSHEHPTQALLDLMSLKEKFGSINKLKVAIVGDILHSRVALSNIFALKMQGANVKLCGPNSLIPKYINKLGVEVINNLDDALKWCDVVNMLRIQNERMNRSFFPSLREYIRLYGLNNERLDKLGREIIIMHPGPINRGVELTSEIADSKNSIILDQVENGVAIRMAVIYLLAKQKFNR